MKLSLEKNNNTRCLSYTANTMPAGALTTLGARASVGMVLIPKAGNIQAQALEEFKVNISIRATWAEQPNVLVRDLIYFSTWYHKFWFIIMQSWISVHVQMISPWSLKLMAIDCCNNQLREIFFINFGRRYVWKLLKINLYLQRINFPLTVLAFWGLLDK